MSKHLTLSFLLLLFFFLILCDTSYGRFITHRTHFSLSSDLVSDGVQQLRGPPYLALNRSSSFSAESTCEQTYGFLPCSTIVLGNIFLIVIYDYLMFLSATYLSNGSEVLLEILGPGIVGGLLLPILGAVPDSMLILDLRIWFSVTCSTQRKLVGGNAVYATSVYVHRGCIISKPLYKCLDFGGIRCVSCAKGRGLYPIDWKKFLPVGV